MTAVSGTDQHCNTRCSADPPGPDEFGKVAPAVDRQQTQQGRIASRHSTFPHRTRITRSAPRVSKCAEDTLQRKRNARRRCRCGDRQRARWQRLRNRPAPIVSASDCFNGEPRWEESTTASRAEESPAVHSHSHLQMPALRFQPPNRQMGATAFARDDAVRGSMNMVRLLKRNRWLWRELRKACDLDKRYGRRRSAAIGSSSQSRSSSRTTSTSCPGMTTARTRCGGHADSGASPATEQLGAGCGSSLRWPTSS